MAEKALGEFGMAGARFKFVRQAGNTVYRVTAEGLIEKPKSRFYEPNSFVLRIHHSSEQTTEAIALELDWLASACRRFRLPVPQPVPTPDGCLLVRVTEPGLDEPRDCSLLRWVKGRLLTKGIGPQHYRAQGRIMAQLHNYSAKWPIPISRAKRSFDYAGLFIDDAGAGMTNGEAWAYLPDHYRKPCQMVAQEVGRVMKRWGRSADVFGLIHGDCGLDANVLFDHGEARIIDFDGSGFGYYVYDLALALEHCWEDADYTLNREALLEGYVEHRDLSRDQLQQMDLFLAAFYVYMSLWTAAMDQVRPDSPHGPSRRQRWQERGLQYYERFILQG